MFAASSILFVPGSRPDRFAKARDAGAGVTVIDLEDAVPADGKDAARSHAIEAMASGGEGWAIRINAVETADGMADLLTLRDAGALPQFVFLPMVQEARDVEIAARVLGDACPHIVPLVETPRALRHALAIASAPKVAAMMFGGGDFAAELGVKLSWEPLLAARQQLLLACAERQLPLIDVPWIHLDDEEGLAGECAHARAMGFAAKAAIHPRQVTTIDKAFTPSEREVNEAEEALRAYDDAGGKVIRHKGRMLETPIVKHYRAIVAKAAEQKQGKASNA